MTESRAKPAIDYYKKRVSFADILEMKRVYERDDEQVVAVRRRGTGNQLLSFFNPEEEEQEGVEEEASEGGRPDEREDQTNGNQGKDSGDHNDAPDEGQEHVDDPHHREGAGCADSDYVNMDCFSRVPACISMEACATTPSGRTRPRSAAFYHGHHDDDAHDDVYRHGHRHVNRKSYLRGHVSAHHECVGELLAGMIVG